MVRPNLQLPCCQRNVYFALPVMCTTLNRLTKQIVSVVTTAKGTAYGQDRDLYIEN